MEVELSSSAETPKPIGDEKTSSSFKELVSASFTSMGSGNSFNRILNGVKVLSATPPSVLVELTLAEEHTNDTGLMHTGFTAAMADILTATAVRLTAAQNTPIVSIDLSVTYLQPARIGETVLMEANCLRAGRSIAFTEAIFRRKSDSEVIVRASQQLAILHYRLPPKTKGEDETEAKKGAQSDNKNSSELPVSNGFANGGDEMGNGTSQLDQVQRSMAWRAGFKNFNRMSKNLKVVRAEPLAVEVKLEFEHLNEGGTMHGGFVASLVDIVAVRAVDLAVPNCQVVSMFVSISYLLPAKIGEEVVVKAECLKVGRSIAFTETTFSRKSDGAVLAKGKHNIYMMRHSDGPHKTEN
uniref:4HBT domain-containing protein n=1 Tax=Globodera pallida TaxID=36090 RepID=A0A183C4N2_GLOPA